MKENNGKMRNYKNIGKYGKITQKEYYNRKLKMETGLSTNIKK